MLDEKEIMALFSPLELLCISLTFLPEKLEGSLTVFANNTHPNLLKKGIRLSELVIFLNHLTPLIYWESDSEKVDLWNMTA